jgi:molybdopterin molybdotransferase
MNAMKGFPRLHSVEDALAEFAAAWTIRAPAIETPDLRDALGRVLAADVVSADDLPPFERSAVDGFAVASSDVEGAAAGSERTLRVVGEVRMGEPAAVALHVGEAARMPTGGMMPAGADAVVMQEVCSWAGQWVRVGRSVTPGENVIRRGEDVRRGDVALRSGTRLRPQEIAILAGLGITRTPCARAPRVAVFSTGDEVVRPDRTPLPGQVRDMNAWGLAAQVERLGGMARVGGILADDAALVERALREAMAENDAIVLSGGSSVGTRDVQDQVLPRLGAPGVLVHGVKIKPGKPTLLAVCDEIPIVGLPGHPVSSMIVFELFVRPLLEAMLGVPPERRGARHVEAALGRALRAPADRDEYVRVALRWEGGVLRAEPVLGKSSMMTTMTNADGFTLVRAGAKIDEGARVNVALFE